MLKTFGRFLVALVISVAPPWESSSEPLSALSTEASERLVQQIAVGHGRWAQRLDEVYGIARHLPQSTQEAALRDLAPYVFFLQKGSLYREDVLGNGTDQSPTRTTIITPQRFIEVDWQTKPPSVEIYPPAPIPFPRAPHVRASLNAVIMKIPVPLVQMLKEGDYTISEAREEIRADGGKVITIRLEVTEKGAKAAGFPSPPPKDWYDHVLWLDAAKDYGIVKSKRAAFAVANAMTIRENGTIELAERSAGILVPRRVTVEKEILMEGKVFQKTSGVVEFADVTYGGVEDKAFTVHGLGLPAETLVHDRIAGRKYRLDQRQPEPVR